MLWIQVLSFLFYLRGVYGNEKSSEKISKKAKI